MDMEIACTTQSRIRGLLGRPTFEGTLLLTPCHDIHTFGLRRAIDVAFVAADGTVIEAHRNVKPRNRLRCRDAVATLERYSTYEPWFRPGDRVSQEMRTGQLED